VEAKRLARRACHRAERRRPIVAAVGIDVDDLSPTRRRILDSLIDWDEPTIDGIIEGGVGDLGSRRRPRSRGWRTRPLAGHRTA
jgi:hypothetical protein